MTYYCLFCLTPFSDVFLSKFGISLCSGNCLLGFLIRGQWFKLLQIKLSNQPNTMGYCCGCRQDIYMRGPLPGNEVQPGFVSKQFYAAADKTVIMQFRWLSLVTISHYKEHRWYAPYFNIVQRNPFKLRDLDIGLMVGITYTWCNLR